MEIYFPIFRKARPSFFRLLRRKMSCESPVVFTSTMRSNEMHFFQNFRAACTWLNEVEYFYLSYTFCSPKTCVISEEWRYLPEKKDGGSGGRAEGNTSWKSWGARRNIWIKSQNESNFNLTRKRYYSRPSKRSDSFCLIVSSSAIRDTQAAKNSGVSSWKP